MPSTELVTMRYNTVTVTAYISSEMTAAEIYEELRAAFNDIIGDFHIAIIDTARNVLATLDYHELKDNVVYDVTVTSECVHGPGTSSNASRRTHANLVVVMQDWGLQSAWQIFPAAIAPRTVNAEGELPVLGDLQITALLDPEMWSTRFTTELRRLSRRSQGRHAEVMELLEWVVEERYEREEDPVKCVTTADLANAVVRTSAQQAGVLVAEEDRANEVFGGGLAEALAEVENEEDEQQEEAGFFTLPLH